MRFTLGYGAGGLQRAGAGLARDGRLGLTRSMAGLAHRKLILRGMMTLPAPILRGLSGGGVVYRGGRTLDPRFQFLAKAARLEPLSGAAPETVRRSLARGLSLLRARPEPEVRIESYTAVEGPQGAVFCRLYRPQDQDPSIPPLVFAHLGGGVLGDLDMAEAFCSILAKVTKGPVLSVDYRLAPEHRFPAGLEDVLAAFRHARDNAERFGGPAGEAAIGGEGIGAGFAAAAGLILRDNDEPPPSLCLLVCPQLDMASESQSMTTYAEAFPLGRAGLDWALGHYLAHDADPADPHVSPLRARDLSGLPPTVVATAGFDPLADQGEAFARRLREAGVPTIFRCYEALAHGFSAYTALVPAADVACREIAGLAREALEGRLS